MMESCKDIKNLMPDQLRKDYENLNIRVGIHTGKIIAGFIGSKVVKYDIFGENVLIASKLKTSTPPGKICISEACKQVLESSNRAYKMFSYTFEGDVRYRSVDVSLAIYSVSVRDDFFGGS